ncbi:MAG: carbonic anhydrase family protein [Bacteroidia bacterium]
MRTLTKEAQAAITPHKAIELLKKGNERFINNLKFNRDMLQQVVETADGQHPFACILTCIDSRTSSELIFDQGFGDIFTCRVAGNIVNEDILGSMEFACKVAGAKAIVVIGHTQCGAIKGACDQVKMGHLSTLLKKIQPAIEAETETQANRNSGNSQFVENVAELNVKLAIKEILDRSEVLAEMAKKGEILVVGAMYDIQTGEVHFYEEG